MNCFNCGKPLKLNSIKCPHCGYMPNIEFARKCPNLKGSTCTVTSTPCKFLECVSNVPYKKMKLIKIVVTKK